jgi:hypothetical protein
MPIRTFAMMDLVMTPVAFRCVVASGGQLTKSRSCYTDEAKTVGQRGQRVG